MTNDERLHFYDEFDEYEKHLVVSAYKFGKHCGKEIDHGIEKRLIQDFLDAGYDGDWSDSIRAIKKLAHLKEVDDLAIVHKLIWDFGGDPGIMGYVDFLTHHFLDGKNFKSIR